MVLMAIKAFQVYFFVFLTISDLPKKNSVFFIGEKGFIGPIGNSGSQGLKGSTGLIGLKGDKVLYIIFFSYLFASLINVIYKSKGRLGPRGPDGFKGLNGNDGLKGNRAPDGIKGNKGLAIKGDEGQQGLLGDKGDMG